MGDKMEKIEKVKRGGFLRGMLDGWRSSVGSQGGSPSHSTGSGSFSGSRGDNSVDIDERLRPTNFDLLQVSFTVFCQLRLERAFSRLPPLYQRSCHTNDYRAILRSTSLYSSLFFALAWVLHEVLRRARESSERKYCKRGRCSGKGCVRPR